MSAGAYIRATRGRAIAVTERHAAFLTRLYAVPVDDCPPYSSVAAWLRIVQRLVSDGHVDADESTGSIEVGARRVSSPRSRTWRCIRRGTSGRVRRLLARRFRSRATITTSCGVRRFRAGRHPAFYGCRVARHRGLFIRPRHFWIVSLRSPMTEIAGNDRMSIPSRSRASSTGVPSSAGATLAGRPRAATCVSERTRHRRLDERRRE